MGNKPSWEAQAGVVCLRDQHRMSVANEGQIDI